MLSLDIHNNCGHLFNDFECQKTTISHSSPNQLQIDNLYISSKIVS